MIINLDDQQNNTSQQANYKIAQINDTNRIIKNRVNNFRTVFLRYRAKNDLLLSKELQEMNLNLEKHGVELRANTKNI